MPKLKLVSNEKIQNKEFDFEMKVMITADITNAEGNMTHYEYVRLFFQAVERYISKDIFVDIMTPTKMSFKYIKDVLPGQKVTIKLWVHEHGVNSMTFLAEFIDAKTATVHAVGVQEAYVKKQHGLVSKKVKSKAIVQAKRLRKWIETVTESRVAEAKFILTTSETVYFGQTNYMGIMNSFEFANLFGDVREEFGLRYIPNFKNDIGKKFVLITNEAHYLISKRFQFGDKIKTSIWVESVSKASFILRCEFWKGRQFCGSASQRIAYYNLLTKKVRLPDGLHKQLTMVAGYTKFSFMTKRIISFLMQFKFFWK